MRTTFFDLRLINLAQTAKATAKLAYDKDELFKAKAEPMTPFPVIIDPGKQCLDFMSLVDVCNFGVSHRVHQLMVDHKVTGWSSFPWATGNPDLIYRGIQISGRADGVLSRKEKGFVTGLSFDEDSWDGSDIFTLKGSLRAIISPRFKDLLLNEAFSNLELRALSEVEWYNF
jgi:hypothetical protein